MKCETIRFSESKRVRLKTYLSDWSTMPWVYPTRAAVIVLPGGGYQMFTASEGEPIALAFAAAGYQAFVLEYRLNKEAEYPNPMVDAGLCVKYVRQRAAEWSIDPDKIILCGMSAGGQVAGGLCLKWQTPEMQQACGLTGPEPDPIIRPDAMIASYTTSTLETNGDNAMCRLLRGSRTKEEMKYLASCEYWASPLAPPLFVWHCYYDQMVPVEQSLILAQSLAKYDVPFELHIFGSGGHGGGLFTPATALGDQSRIDPHAANWFPLCLNWLRKRFGDPTLPREQTPLPGEHPRAHMGHQIPLLFEPVQAENQETTTQEAQL